MEFQTRFNPMVYDGTFNDMPSVTEQNHKDECDINVLYKRFVKELRIDERHTDVLSVLNKVQYDMNAQPIESAANDALTLYGTLDKVRQSFYKLDPQLREKFGNDHRLYHQALVDGSVYKVLGVQQKGVENVQTPSVQTEVKQDIPQNSEPHS